MKRIKIFRSGDGFDRLEELVNQWLEDNSTNVKVISLHYQDNQRYASIIVFYEK